MLPGRAWLPAVYFSTVMRSSWIFPDESFDVVISNYVYHNVMGADMQKLLLESLRVLKKGGVFALNDDMKQKMYGDMEGFAQKLRDMGYEEVRLVDTAQEAFWLPTVGLP